MLPQLSTLLSTSTCTLSCACAKSGVYAPLLPTRSGPENGLQLLEDHQLQTRGGGEARPNWNKTRVQTQGSILLDNLGQENDEKNGHERGKKKSHVT
jgi:hypothetical protein